MILFTVFTPYAGNNQTGPDVAVEISAITHVEVGPFGDSPAGSPPGPDGNTDMTQVCTVYAGPRKLAVVRADLEDVLSAIRNAR